jgi:dTDP-4-amino-4,6-dideoxygalactose transaminase
MNNKVSFNKPYLTGKELDYIKEAVERRHISGNGYFTKKCQHFFEEKWHFKKCLLTTSCTDALEMSAMLLDIKPGDEVIIPSYTFVSTALAFVRQGAKIIFADSRPDRPGIDESKIESLITSKTKAIVPVHYAGVACDMDRIMQIANNHNLFVVEDAAQAFDSYYNEKPLGSIGHLGCFSFHETKNIQSGEGGLLTINDSRFIKRAEILWEKGTNRAEFFRGEINKYGWVDIGSSFLPSDLIAAFLWAQLEHYDEIQTKRLHVWNLYFNLLQKELLKHDINMPSIPEFASNNAHMFYLVCKNPNERSDLINYLRSENIQAVFHYLSLHESDYYSNIYKPNYLPNCNLYAEQLVRLPLYYELNDTEIKQVTDAIIAFYNKTNMHV